MIEKTITEKMLESGELSLTELESSALELPEHSTTITIELDGESFGAQWNGRSRIVQGDILTDSLQGYGQIKGLLRLRLAGDLYRLEILAPGSVVKYTDFRPPIAPPKPPSPINKKKDRRATVDRQFHADSEYDWRRGQKIGFLTEAKSLLREQLSKAGFDPLELLELRLQGEELATLDDFEELIAVDVANVDRMPHQEAVARHALSRMRGRAVLADEVGLGKTVEAGLAMKELTLRGLAKRVLILCPAPLRDQWREEMLHKFDMTFDAAYGGADVRNQDKLIVSLNLGIRSADKLTKEPWDIVILDEAHRAAGAGARKTREFITSLTTSCRYAFFLTATPVQNDLLELYRIVELLRPGTFSSVSTFKRQFMTRLDPRTPNDPAGLRRLISSVMIRTTRAQAGVDRVVRRATDVPVDLGTRERELYALSTDLLRNVMTDSADTMRRRTLALRLTASPFSMGTTAMAMAQKHPNARVRSVLNEVGHLAMDIKGSARENRAIEITHDWVREHGRVLIFSKHTDTVTSLLRRMEEEGLPARAFHSSMSVSERAATISAFRSGEAPVMISTDAGAEGQNLQFCNCVLNYDLPWNPMRIEQRIGRVDRLTQPRDEVFVANLYARNTIDESVYRLLAEKLRMFELLFGQVTTILGELDDSKSATFESRVLEALFAENDSKMTSLLNQLGTELAGARERASNLIAADKGMSEWMAGAFEHRKELPKGGASELMPEVSERTRMRQRRVQAWVRRTLEALGAEFVHDTGEEDGAFITAKFSDEFEEELGGRTTLHLAFDRRGLDHHPEAELCAIGSPVFDELLALLRMRGDLYATVPVIPEELGPSPLRHSDRIRLVSRRLVPTGNWRGQATFRANVGEAETTEHIITADIVSPSEFRLPRRPLEDGEVLPKVFADTVKVLRRFEDAAAIQLDRIRTERETSIINEQKSELKRIRSGYQAQISESAYEDRIRLQRALDSEEKRLGRRPDVRARAKVLALAIEEDDWVVEEAWSRVDGVEASLTYEWTPKGLPRVASAATGTEIQVLALCSAAHAVDQSEVSPCASCDSDLCGACGSAVRMTPCPLCDLPMCGNCRKESGGLCRRCASPERAAESDQEHARAWRLNAGNILLVGQRFAELVPAGGAPSVLLVPNKDAEDPGRARVRAYARAHGLPADSGLKYIDRTGRRPEEDLARLRLTTSESVTAELSVGAAGGSALDEAVLADVPEFPVVDVVPERELKLEKLLSRLRDAAPPPAPPAVVVTRRAQFVDYVLEIDRVVRETLTVDDSGECNVIDVQAAELDWRDATVTDATLAQAAVGDLRVSITRRNDAVLVSAEGPQLAGPAEWLACPEGQSAESQLAYFDLLDGLGRPGGRVGQRSGEASSIVGSFPTPTECQLTERFVTWIATLVDAESQAGLVPANEAPLDALKGKKEQGPARVAPSPIPSEISRRLLEKTARDFTQIAMTGFKVSEWWHGHGSAQHTYETFDGQPLGPELDDVKERATDFGICREGHFYEARSAALCESCQTWACRACDEYEHRASTECPTCASSVCRRCLLAAHDVPDARCLNCGAHACVNCGRDPIVFACSMCARPMCSGCRSDETCGACSQLAVATLEQLDALPAELAIVGASVWAGEDTDAMVIFISRGGTVERAILRNGLVADWSAFGLHQISDAYRLRIAASRAVRAQVVPVAQKHDSDTSITLPHITIDADHAFRVAWNAPEIGFQGVGKSKHSNVDDDPIPFAIEDFPTATAFPSPQPGTPARVKNLVASTPAPALRVLKVYWIPAFRDIFVSESGIVAKTLLGEDYSESVASWSDKSGTLAWLADDWSPVPDVLLYARSDEAEAAVVGLGLMLALGVRFHDATLWFEINRSDDAAAATTLSRWLGLGDADQVGKSTDPSTVRYSIVSNAVTGSALEVQPVGEVTGKPMPRGADALAALRAWLPDATIAVPALEPLPSALRGQLEHLARTEGSTSTRTLDIGVLVKESIALGDGQVVVRETRLAPGQADARRLDDVAGDRLDEGILDREGHFTRALIGCHYCQSWLCAKCDDGLTACGCCGQAICKRCVAAAQPQLSLCPACNGIHPPTRREAREHGRLLSTRGMLVGSDNFHAVIFERSKGRWERKQDGALNQPVISPSITSFLDSRLAS